MKRYILLMSLGLLLSSSVLAQKATIVDSKIVEENDRVEVTFSTRIGKLKSDERLSLIPVIYHGDTVACLDTLSVVGRNRRISQERLGLNSGDLRYEKSGQVVFYNNSVAYQSWMGDISMRLESKVESCCTEHPGETQEVVQKRPIRYDVVLAVADSVTTPISPIETELDPVLMPFLSSVEKYDTLSDPRDIVKAKAAGALILCFRMGSTEIDPSYRNNADILNKISHVVGLIEKDPNANLSRIQLAGSSSPDGRLSTNTVMTDKRIESFKQYISTNILSQAQMIETINVGEDWDGLRTIIDASDMEYKDEVLYIIDNVSDIKERKKQLKALRDGSPYYHMFIHFFPQLRSVGFIHIFYDSKPSPDVVNTNTAIELYNKAYYADALDVLLDVSETALTVGLKGVCQMMLGQYDLAQQTLTRAVEMGDVKASANLKQLEKLRAVKQATN